MIEIEDGVPVPFEIGGEKGTLMVFSSKKFELREYSYHPFFGGRVVLAVPHNGTQPDSEVNWYILVRTQWPDRTPEEIARGYWSGVVWTTCRSFQLSLSPYEGDSDHHDCTLNIQTQIGSMAKMYGSMIDLINHIQLMVK